MLQQQQEERTTIHYIKDTIVNCLVLLFERVPEVVIDQNQGSMIDWVSKGSQQREVLEIACPMPS